MKLATVRTQSGTRAVRVEGDTYVDLGCGDLNELLEQPDWARLALGTGTQVESTGLAPVLPRPRKIFCVGLNYRPHIEEVGLDIPAYPTLFAKFAEALIGSRDEIAMPAESAAMDWEAELVVVIGAAVRHATAAQAAAAIAGYTVMNDVSARDWQTRTGEWLQGKTFEGTTPLGPILVTPDEVPGGVGPTLAISTAVDGVVMQEANTGDLVFGPVALIQYISTIITLQPGDLIATGTPGGVGMAQTPARYLQAGEVVVTEVESIGQLVNRTRSE